VNTTSQTFSVLAAQTVFNSRFQMLAKVELGHEMYAISFYEGDTPLGYQLLSTTWPLTHTLPTANFQLSPNIYLSDTGWEIFASDFNRDEIQGALSQKYSLTKQFGQDRWIIINWFLNQEKLTFISLFSYPQEKINLWTRTEYSVLSQTNNNHSTQHSSHNNQT
jgi:hypothetical protein